VKSDQSILTKRTEATGGREDTSAGETAESKTAGSHSAGGTVSSVNAPLLQPGSRLDTDTTCACLAVTKLTIDPLDMDQFAAPRADIVAIGS